MHAADSNGDSAAGDDVAPPGSLVVRAFVEAMSGQRQPATPPQQSGSALAWGVIDFTGTKPNPANTFVVKSGWAPFHLLPTPDRTRYLLSQSGGISPTASLQEAEAIAAKVSWVPVVVKSWVDPSLGSNSPTRWNMYGGGLAPIDGRHSEFVHCSRQVDIKGGSSYYTIITGDLNKCVLTVRDTFGDLAPLLVDSRRLASGFSTTFQVILSAPPENTSPLAQDVVLRTAVAASLDMLGEVTLSFHVLTEDVATALGDFSSTVDGGFIATQSAQRVMMTFTYLGQPIGSMLPQGKRPGYQPSGGIMNTTAIKVSSTNDDAARPNSVLTSTLRFGSHRPVELTAAVLDRLDVREVVAAGIARGLGLDRYLHVFIVRVLDCGVEECEDGYSDTRRRRRRRVLRRQQHQHQQSRTFLNHAREQQLKNHPSRRLGAPAPAPSSSSSFTSSTTTSSTSTTTTAAPSSSSSRFLPAQPDVEIVFEVVGPTSIVNVAKARLAGQPDPLVSENNETLPTLPTFSTALFAANISQSLESSHGDLPGLLGFVILPQGPGDAANATQGGGQEPGGSGRTVGQFVTPESIGSTTPTTIDGENLLPQTTTAAPVVPSPSAPTDVMSPSPSSSSSDLTQPTDSFDVLPPTPSLVDGSGVATAVISIVLVALMLGGFAGFRALKKWRQHKRQEMYTHYKVKRALRKKKKRLEALQKLTRGKDSNARATTSGVSVSDKAKEDTMKKEAALALLLEVELDHDNEDDVDLLLSELDPETRAKLEEAEDMESDSDMDSVSVASLPSGLPAWLRCLEPCLMPSKRSARVMPDFEFFIPGEDGIPVDNTPEARRKRAINTDWMSKYRTISPYLYSVDAKGRPRKPDAAPVHPTWPPPPGLRRKQLENLRIYRRQLMSFEQAERFNKAAKRLQRMWRHNRVWGHAMRVGLWRISSARKIQRVWLGKKGRMRWRARFDLVDGLNRAALRLQLTWYRKSGMFSTFVLMRALWVLDTREKAAEHMRHLRARHSAAIFLQYRWKMTRWRRHRKASQKASRCIQRMWRAYSRSKEWRLLRRELRLANRMAVRVQLQWYRRNGEFATFVLMRCLTWHGDQQEIQVAKEIVAENQSVRLLQRMWRGKMARRRTKWRFEANRLPGSDFMQPSATTRRRRAGPETEDNGEKPAPPWMQRHLASKMERSIAEANYKALPAFEKSQMMMQKKEPPPSMKEDWLLPGRGPSQGSPGRSFPPRAFPTQAGPRGARGSPSGPRAGPRGPTRRGARGGPRGAARAGPRGPPPSIAAQRSRGGRPRARPNFSPSRGFPSPSRGFPRGSTLGASPSGRPPPNFSQPNAHRIVSSGRAPPPVPSSVSSPSSIVSSGGSRSRRAPPPSGRGNPPTPRGSPPTPRGRPLPQSGRPPPPGGRLHSPKGNPPKPRGRPSTPRGNPPTPRGRPPTPRGNPPKPRGRPNGRPPPPSGRPPPPSGRSPAPRHRPPTSRSQPATPRGRTPLSDGRTPRGWRRGRGRPPPGRGRSRGSSRPQQQQQQQPSLAMIEATRAATAARAAADAADASRQAMEKRLEAMQLQLAAREAAVLDMQREKEKHDREASNEASKRLGTQRALADARLLREQRRFDKMRAALEEEKRAALDRLKLAEERRKIEEERAAVVKLEVAAEKSKIEFLEKEAARALELEEELLEREADLERASRQQEEDARRVAEEEMHRVSEAAINIEEEEKTLKAQLVALSEARLAEKAAAEDAAREQAKREAARIAKEAVRLDAMEGKLQEQRANHAFLDAKQAQALRDKEVQLEEERQAMERARHEYAAKLKLERDAEIAAMERKVAAEAKELHSKLDALEAEKTEKEAQLGAMKMKVVFSRFSSQARQASTAKQLAVAEMERRRAEGLAALAEEERKVQENAAVLERERIERQTGESMARELEEQRVLLEDRMRRTLKDHDEQVKEARGRMQARLAKLEQDKKRAIAMADNKQGAASAKKEAIAAVTSARAEMIAAISRLKREMEDRARQSQEEHAALLSKQREARIAREEKEKARITREKQEREEEEGKAKEAQEAANQREVELQKQLHDLKASSKAAEVERERKWQQKIGAEREKIEQSMAAAAAQADVNKQHTAAERKAIEKVHAEKLETERLRHVEEKKASDAMLTQAKLELERASAERVALEKATAARLKFAAAEAKWEREAEVLQALRKQERALEQKMESRVNMEKRSWSRLRQKEKSAEETKVSNSEARLKIAMAEIDAARQEMARAKTAALDEKASLLKKEGEMLERLNRVNTEKFTTNAGSQGDRPILRRRHSVHAGTTSPNPAVSLSRMTPEQVLAIKLRPAPNPSNKQAYNIYVRRLERRQRAEDEIKARGVGGGGGEGTMPGARRKRVPLRERIAAARAERMAAAEMEEAAKTAAAARKAVEAKSNALEEKRKADARQEKMARQRKKAASKNTPANEANPLPQLNPVETKLETAMKEEKIAEDYGKSDFVTPVADGILSPLTARRPPANEDEPDEITQAKNKNKNENKNKEENVDRSDGGRRRKTPREKRPRARREIKPRGLLRVGKRKKRKLAAMHKRMNRLSMRRIDPARLRTASVRVRAVVETCTVRDSSAQTNGDKTGCFNRYSTIVPRCQRTTSRTTAHEKHSGRARVASHVLLNLRQRSVARRN